MYAFLPELIGTIIFVGLFIKGELFKSGLHSPFFQVVDDLTGDVRFETRYILAYMLTLSDQMDVVFQDYISV